MDLFQQSERLTVVDRVGETGGMVGLAGPFSGDLAGTNNFERKFQETQLRIADGY